MATRKPNRRDYPAGRSGAAQYAAAVRKYNQSQARRTTQPDTRTETQRRRDARRSTRTTTRARQSPTERRRGMSNIPPAEGMVNNPNYGKPGDPKSAERRIEADTQRNFNEGAAQSSGNRAQKDAYSRDERNRKYDELRRAGKTKEAEKLGKQIAADARKNAPENKFRAPQGAERTDRLSKVLKELRGMRRKASTSGTTGVGPVKDGDTYAAGVRSSRRSSTDPVTRYGSGGRRATTRDTSKDQSRSATSRSRSSRDPVTRYGSGGTRAVTRDTSKDKKKRQSRAQRAGWANGQGNQNY